MHRASYTNDSWYNKATQDSMIPTRGSERAVGYDLYSIEDKEVECYAEKGSMIRTGIAI